ALLPGCPGPTEATSCTTRADCTDPKNPVCDPMLHLCQPCSLDSQCPGQVCRAGSCGPECDAMHACANGQTRSPGHCVHCVEDKGCGGATPRCLVSMHHCVACLPGPTDNCGTNLYCAPADNTCKPGCKADSDCPTGTTCLPSHDCSPCTDDSHCSG